MAIQANTVYVASYSTSNGQYAADIGGLASGRSVGNLTALSDADGGNGVYEYGLGGGFPADTYQASNDYVDVRFSTTP